MTIASGIVKYSGSSGACNVFCRVTAIDEYFISIIQPKNTKTRFVKQISQFLVTVYVYIHSSRRQHLNFQNIDMRDIYPNFFHAQPIYPR